MACAFHPTRLERRFEDKMKALLRPALAGICVLALLGCGTYINSATVKDLPAKSYEKIIHLRTENPSALYQTLGVIYVLPGKKIWTNYPYQKELKSENELTYDEKLNLDTMKVVELKNKAGEVQGYIKIMGPAIVNTWQRDSGVLVQIDMSQGLGNFPVPMIGGESGGGGGGSVQ